MKPLAPHRAVMIAALIGYAALMPHLIDPYVNYLHAAIAAVQSTVEAIAHRAVHPKRYHP